MRLISFVFLCSAFVTGCSTTSNSWTTKSDLGPWNKSEECNFEAKSGDYSVFGTYFMTVSEQPVCTSTTCSDRNRTSRTYTDTKRYAGFNVIYDPDTAVPREGSVENFPPTPLNALAGSALKTNPSGDFARFKLATALSQNQTRLTLALPPELTWERAVEMSPGKDVVFRIQHPGASAFFERDARIWSWNSPLGSNEPAGTYMSLDMTISNDGGGGRIIDILLGSDDNLLTISDRETGTLVYQARLPRLPDRLYNETFLRWAEALDTCSPQ